MRKIYLVKKNPEQPADGNNWIVMNSFEFMNFVKTPEGQKRKACFGQLDACSVDDVIIIAECGAETAKQWRSEKDRHDYLASIEKQSGMTVFSYNTQITTEDEMSGEELLADNQSDVVEEVLRRFQKAHIQETLAALLPEERDLIESLTFTTATSSLPTCSLREEKSFSQRAFSIYTDIRKLQDKAKSSYTLIKEEAEVLI